MDVPLYGLLALRRYIHERTEPLAAGFGETRVSSGTREDSGVGAWLARRGASETKVRDGIRVKEGPAERREGVPQSEGEVPQSEG
jgi:hypothetical protein